MRAFVARRKNLCLPGILIIQGVRLSSRQTPRGVSVPGALKRANRACYLRAPAAAAPSVPANNHLGGPDAWAFAVRRTPCSPVSAPAGRGFAVWGGRASAWPGALLRRARVRLGPPRPFSREVCCVLRRWLWWRSVAAGAPVGRPRPVGGLCRPCRRRCRGRLRFGGGLGRGSGRGGSAPAAARGLLRLALLLLRRRRRPCPLGCRPRRPRCLVRRWPLSLPCGGSGPPLSGALAFRPLCLRRRSRPAFAGHVARRSRRSRCWRPRLWRVPCPPVGGCFWPSSAWGGR